ncbi:MAG: protein jag [Chloroflexi bacterium]|nr:protein jag [Chloroflexota bacterium]
MLGLGAEEARISVRSVSAATTADVPKVARDILSELLEKMGVKASVEIVEPPLASMTPDSKVVALDITGDDLGILIGRRGQTLMSLQYLINLLVSHKTKARVPVMVDVEGYKRRRYEALQSLAERLADQVKSTKRAVTLEPMPANERRIIHLALSNDPEVTTQSVGAGEGRKVVIAPKGRETHPQTPRRATESDFRPESRERQA